jgi:diketogulonate reductase-like aldo/keto reductase
MPLLGFGVYQNYQTTKESVLEAFKAGYAHVDSAQMYQNEADVGAAVRESGIDRSKLFITTKCNSGSHGYQSTLKGVDQSLARFGLDYIDLFLIHDPLSGSQRRMATYKALKECQKAGKIRSVGVSNYGIRHLEEIRAAGYEMPAVNQIEIHPLCQQKPIVEYCRKNDIVIQAYSPLRQGDFKSGAIPRIAKKHNRDPAQIMLRWSLQKGYVPLPKSATPSRIRSNANLYDFELDEDDMKSLDAMDIGGDGAVCWNPVDAP